MSPLGGRRRTSSCRPRTTRAGSGSRETGLPLRRRPEDARARRTARSPRRRSTPTSGSKLGATVERRDLGAGLRSRYGYNNRTQMLRIPGAGRIEDRTVDGSCNPYLAATAVLAAGLDGIEHGLDPGEPNSENLYATRTSELTDARPRDTARRTCSTRRGELEADDVLRAALGRGAGRGLRRLLHPRASGDEWQPATTSRSRPGRSGVPDALLAYGGNLHTPGKSGRRFRAWFIVLGSVAEYHMCGIVGLFASRPRSRSASARTSRAMLAQMRRPRARQRRRRRLPRPGARRVVQADALLARRGRARGLSCARELADELGGVRRRRSPREPRRVRRRRGGRRGRGVARARAIPSCA